MAHAVACPMFFKNLLLGCSRKRGFAGYDCSLPNPHFADRRNSNLTFSADLGLSLLRFDLWRIVMMSAILSLVDGTVLMASKSVSTRDFDLPSSDVSRALKLFSEQSGRGVIVGSDVVRGVRSNPVRGEMSAADALERLLANTGLIGLEDTQSGVFAVRKSEGAGQSRLGTLPSGIPRDEEPTRHQNPMKNPSFFAPLAMIVSLVAGSPIHGQSTDTGSISGRVYKPGTGEFVRNAEIRIVGTNRSIESDEQGHYRIDHVPAGNIELVVSYIGYRSESARVNVGAGQIATRDFDLYPLDAMRDGTVTLQAFEVTAEREGNAKALQDQKRSMNIGSIVGSELFGDTAEGNVGEFLKYLPGVDLEYVTNNARGPRMRGMDSRYVGLTLDGMKLASADAFVLSVGTENGGTDDNRAFSFESVSFSGVDSVEVFKTLSADLDADAPAGAINLRSKRAFDRKGRRIFWQANMSANGEEPYWRRRGPFEEKRHFMRFGGMLEYSDQFFNQRLGVVINFNRSDAYNPQRRTQVQPPNRQTTATDQRPAVPRIITLFDSPMSQVRDSQTLTVDFKVTPTFHVGVVTTFSQYEGLINAQQARFTTSANNTGASGRSTVLGADPMVSFITSPTSAADLSLVGSSNVKLTNSVTITPRFDFRPAPNFTIEGRFGLSKARNDYEGLARGVTSGQVAAMTAANSGLIFRGERPDATSERYTITQVAGRDWGDISNFSGPSIASTERLHFNDVLSGDISARWQLQQGPMRFVKFGIKSREEKTKYNDESAWNRWNYIGPPGTSNPTWEGYASPNALDLGTIGVSLQSISGRPLRFPGRQYPAELFKAHPDYFVHSATPTDYFNAFINSVRDLTERVDAAFVMAHFRFGKFRIQPGVRAEETHTESVSFTQRPQSEVRAMGFPVNAAGRATTIDGLKYQYETLPKTTRKGTYLNWFPSVAFKYDLTENLIAQAGYNKAISRPPLTALSGAVIVNDSALTIVAPNPNLRPEWSDSYSARLAYYFEPTGSLSVGVFQNTIENFRGTYEFSDPETIAELGLDPNVYAGYTVTTQRNIEGSQCFRGLEFDYRQSLNFLPGALRGFNVFASYTRNYADVRRGGMAPHHISAGTSYAYKRFAANIKAIWTPDVPWTQNNTNRFREERIMTDLGFSYQIHPLLTFSASARNVFNTPTRLLESWPEGNTLLYHAVYGSMWVFSLKGTF